MPKRDETLRPLVRKEAEKLFKKGLKKLEKTVLSDAVETTVYAGMEHFAQWYSKKVIDSWTGGQG